MQCGECGIGLPIIISGSEQAVRIACTFCGSLYRGEPWTFIPDHLKGNIRIVRD